jgi:aminoglycoside 3-N-acetyltransferase
MKYFNENINYQEIRNCNSYKTIVNDLKNLGLKSNDTVMVHSSLSSMINVEFGAITFIIALCDVLNEGNVLFPSFTYIQSNIDFTFSYNDSSCCVGCIPETFRKLKNVVRSMHPTHSVCAFGKNAHEIIKDHILDDTPLGKNSPFNKMLNYNGKILMLGCGLYCNSCEN